MNLFKTLLICFVVILQLLLTTGVVFAADPTSKTLVVGSEQDYPPFALGQTDDEADGFTVELWKEVAKEAGLNYTIRVRPFHQILQEFKEGKIDVLINLAQSDERRQVVDFSIPHVIVNGAIFVRKGSSDIHSEADLAGKSIIVLNADLAHDYAVSRGWGKQLVLTATAADGFKLLASGKHDALLISKLAGMQTLHELNISNIRALDTKAGFSQKFSFAVHKGDADLLAKINEGLALTKPNGKFDAIYEKWFGPYEEKTVSLWDVLQYVVPIALIMLGFAGYELYKRRFEHNRSEKAIRVSESRLRAIIDSSPVPLAINDNQGKITYLNRSFIQTIGYTSEEIPTLDIWWPLAYPDPQYRQQVADNWQKHLEESLRTGKPIEPAEAHVTCKDGKVRIFSISASMVVEDPEGAHLVVLYDITDRKAAEKKLLASNQLLDNIVENIPNMIFLKRASDLRFEMFNRAGEALLGHRRDELIGHNDYDFFPQEQADFFTAKDRLALQRDNITDIPEEDIETPHGKRILHTKKIALKDEYGHPTHLLGISEDITERKQAEIALQHAKDLAESLAQSKSAFLANMSHEIRTPMNGIMGLTQLALNQQTTPELRDYLTKIATSSQSLLGILNDILDFSKLEAGKFAIENVPFNLLKVRDTLLNLFSSHAEQKQLAFSIDVDLDVPTDLIGDALRLQQILSNLIGNAIKFTEHGEVKLEIKRLASDNTQVRCRFCISDTGIGMRQDSIDKLFQPFSQADSSITRRFGGTGLGLAISHGLLQLMGSEFTVESHIGKGTRFCFELNLGIAALGMHQETNRRREERTAGALGDELRNQGQKLKGASILVAEDNKINQMVVKEFLKLSGIEVDIANNGVEALEYLRDKTYDAILMDVHMPEMGGIEATEIIRKQPQFTNLPIIALTAGVTQEERNNCKACGMSDFLSKPVNPENLISTLCNWLKREVSLMEKREPVLKDSPTATSSLNDLPGFDLTNLMNMVGNDEALVLQLLHTMQEDTETTLGDIEILLKENNLEEARNLVHTIKGASGNLGAMDLHAAAETLEAQLKQGRLDQEAYANFQKMLLETRETLSRLG